MRDRVDPRWGRDPCAARPRTSISIQTNPRWAITTSSSVGSVTIAASARTWRRTSRTPTLACSSSATAATTTSPASPSAAASRHARAPRRRRPSCRRRRPCGRSPSTRASNGSVIPATPTVSMCPQSSSVPPPPEPRARTTTLGLGCSARRLHLQARRGAPLRDRLRGAPLPGAAGNEVGVHGIDRTGAASEASRGSGRLQMSPPPSSQRPLARVTSLPGADGCGARVSRAMWGPRRG